MCRERTDRVCQSRSRKGARGVGFLGRSTGAWGKRELRRPRPARTQRPVSLPAVGAADTGIGNGRHGGRQLRAVAYGTLLPGRGVARLEAVGEDLGLIDHVEQGNAECRPVCSRRFRSYSHRHFMTSPARLGSRTRCSKCGPRWKRRWPAAGRWWRWSRPSSRMACPGPGTSRPPSRWRRCFRKQLGSDMQTVRAYPS